MVAPTNAPKPEGPKLISKHKTRDEAEKALAKVLQTGAAENAKAEVRDPKDGGNEFEVWSGPAEHFDGDPPRTSNTQPIR